METEEEGEETKKGGEDSLFGKMTLRMCRASHLSPE